ncbi:MAG: DUF6189 family protein [Micromonosporaceae bacterium]
MLPAEGPLRARPCLACGQPWPCRQYRNAGVAYDRATRFYEVIPELPDRFADRIPAEPLSCVRCPAEAGEWRIALEELIACLRHFDVAVTADERQLLDTLVEVMRLPTRVGEPTRVRAALRSI